MRCKYCTSENVIRWGRNRGKQRFRCKNCGHQFLEGDNPPRMKTSIKIIATALDLWFEGLSIRKVQRQIANIYGVYVNHDTIWYWIYKYSKLVGEYIKRLKPKLSGEWVCDETTIRCRDTDSKQLLRWFWQCMDGETRWIISVHLSNDRDSKEALELLRKGLENAKAKPSTLVTDSAPFYEKAYKKLLWARYKAERPTHVKGFRN